MSWIVLDISSEGPLVELARPAHLAFGDHLTGKGQAETGPAYL